MMRTRKTSISTTIIYAANVCSLTVRLKSRKDELSKLQWQTQVHLEPWECLLQLYSGFLLFYLKLEADARTGNYRLGCKKQWKLKSMWSGNAHILGHEETSQLGACVY